MILIYSNILGYVNCELFVELIEYICVYYFVWIFVIEKFKLIMFIF